MTEHLEKHEIIFFDLLKSALWGVDVTVPDDFEQWDQVIKLATDQSLFGLIARAILETPDLINRIPHSLKIRLKSWVVTSALVYDHLSDVLHDLIKVLNENGVDVILLKGLSLAKNYRYPQLRQNGDIDLYVGEDQYLSAYRVLKTCAETIDEEKDIWASKHFHCTVNNAVVEIHRFSEVLPSKKFNRRFQSFSSEGMNERKLLFNLKGVDVYGPDNTFNALYIFTHFFSHFMTEGVGLRQLCDWILFLSKNCDEIDAKKLEAMLKQLHLTKPWSIVTAVSKDYLGYNDCLSLKTSCRITSKQSDYVMSRILHEGNFGHASPYYTKKVNGFIFRKLYSITWHIRRDLQLMKIFPRYTAYYFKYILERGSKSFREFFRKMI